MKNTAVICGYYHNYKIIIFEFKFLTPYLRLNFGNYICYYPIGSPLILPKGFLGSARFTKS